MTNRFFHAPFLLLLMASVAFARGENPLRTIFRENLRHTADSLVTAERTYADTLFSRGDAATGSALALLNKDPSTSVPFVSCSLAVSMAVG